jgi:hypothetical protein
MPLLPLLCSSYSQFTCFTKRACRCLTLRRPSTPEVVLQLIARPPQLVHGLAEAKAHKVARRVWAAVKRADLRPCIHLRMSASILELINCIIQLRGPSSLCTTADAAASQQQVGCSAQLRGTGHGVFPALYLSHRYERDPGLHCEPLAEVDICLRRPPASRHGVGAVCRTAVLRRAAIGAAASVAAIARGVLLLPAAAPRQRPNIGHQKVGALAEERDSR